MLRNVKTSKGIHTVLNILQPILLPLVMIIPVAALLILVLDLEPSAQLTRGILYAFIFLSCTVIALWKYRLSGIGLTYRNIYRNLLYSVIILIVSYIFIFIVQPMEGFASISSDLFWAVLFFLVVAVAEEIWFRGLVFTALYEWKGDWLAVTGSALLFGLMHLPMQGWIGLRHIFYSFPFGVVRLKTGNIWGLIIVHWLVNVADTYIVFSTSELNTGYALVASSIYLLGYPCLAFLILYIDNRVSSLE